MNKKVISENTKMGLELENNQNIAAKLIIASEKLALQVIETEKREIQLILANKELEASNKLLAFQNSEKEDRAAELVIANKELAYQNNEKVKRADELIIAIDELTYQNIEKVKRAEELVVAIEELTFQNSEKEKRANELIIANKELAYQNSEKEKRADELIIANKELAFQNSEKEKRANELIIANKELAYQNSEKEKRAEELIIANKELAYQNSEKEKRAQELLIANAELAFQNIEKEKRAQELLIANKEIESFSYISSHDLQEPLRKIQTFSGRIFVEEYDNLSAMGKYYVERTKLSALHMQTLIDDLLAYSRTKTTQRKFVSSNLNKIVKDAIKMLKEEIKEKKANIEIHDLGEINVIPFQFRQLLQNLISNSLKYSLPEVQPHIIIKSNLVKVTQSNSIDLVLKCDHHHISVIDNGIGFDSKFNDKIFEIFQRLHHKNAHKGTGIGLTIARKIVENHNGIIKASGVINKGSQFDIYIPLVQVD
jgi:signal transduction histidine kinase